MNVYVSTTTGISVRVSTPTSHVSTPIVGGNVPVSWIYDTFYPRSNPSGFASGIDASSFVLKSESGQFYPASNPSGFTTGISFKFSTSLNSGAEFQNIGYPTSLSQTPSAIACEIVNDIDDFIYTHALSSVTNTGFRINFSDNLISTGYVLLTTIGL